MKVVLKASMVLLVVFFMTQTAMAQKGDFKGKKGKHGAAHLEKMAEELELTDEQVAKLKEIRKEFGAKKKAIRENSKEKSDQNREANKEAFRKMREEYKTAVEQVLTPAQIEKQKALKEAHKAEMKEKRAANKDKMKELHIKASAYTKKNILPVVLEQRAKLDKKMSKKDRKEVDRLRAEMKAMKPQMKAMHKEMKAAKKAGNTTDAQMEKAKALKTKMHETMKAAKVIADKYETQITTLREEVSDKETQWKTDLKRIAEDAGLEKPEREMRGRGHHKEKGEKNHGRKRGHHHGMKGEHHQGMMGMMKMHGAKFVLLDPNMEMEEFFEEIEPTVTEKPAVKIYPNPASVANTLAFETAKAGQVTIEIRNKDGVLVRTVKDEYMEAGKHTIQVNLGDLNEYVYYYVIRDETGQRTEKFVIRK